MDSKEFRCEGNLFADLESLTLKADITPKQHKPSSMDGVVAWNLTDGRHLCLYNPLILSLPSNDDLKSLLTSLSTRLTNRYSHPAGFETPKLKMLVLHNNTNFNRSE